MKQTNSRFYRAEYSRRVASRLANHSKINYRGMIATTVLCALATFFAYLAKYPRFQDGLKMSFILIFLFLATRYNFGNDYENYHRLFFEINRSASPDLSGQSLSLSVEPAWILLNWIFKPFGFYAMVAALALFHCYAYFQLMTRYVPRDYYWLAILLYVLNPLFLLIQLSAMRQGVAICFFLVSLKYLSKRDALRYYLCIGAATLFHTSAIVLVPVFMISFYDGRISRTVAFVIVPLFITGFLCCELLSSPLQDFVAGYFGRYASYRDPGEIGSGIGLCYQTVMLIGILYLATTESTTGESSIMCKVAILNYILIPFSMIIQIVDRMEMYFQAATLAVFPMFLCKIKRIEPRIMLTVLMIAYVGVAYYKLFYTDLWHDSYISYKTLFSDF